LVWSRGQLATLQILTIAFSWWRRPTALRANVSPFHQLTQGVLLFSFNFFSLSFAHQATPLFSPFFAALEGQESLIAEQTPNDWLCFCISA